MKLKKLFTSMAVTALALGSMFMTAMADDSYANLNVSDAEYDAMEDQSGEGWSWDVDTSTLTLDGFEGTDIYFESDLTSVVNLVIEGTNTVESYNNSDAVAMYSTLGEFTVSGDGTLNVTYAGDDSLSFNGDDGTVSFSDVTINLEEVSYGICAEDVTLDGVTISADEVYEDLFFVNSLEITDTEISVVDCWCLFATDDVSVSNSKITADSLEHFVYSYGDGVTISDSTITVGEVYSFIYAYSVDISNSTINLSSSETYSLLIYCRAKSNEDTDSYESGPVSITDSELSWNVAPVFDEGESDAEAYGIVGFDTLTIDGSVINLTGTEVEEGQSLDATFVPYFMTSIDVTDSTITLSDWNGVFGYGASETGTVTVTDSEITGDAQQAFGMFDTFKVENSVIDLETIETILVRTFEVIDSEVTLVGENTAFAYVENLNITDSAVYFENVESTGFQVEEGGYGGFVNYTLTYTTPEYWGLYLDGELSEDYTVESTDIVFGDKILEIRYIHECTFDEYVSDGADTHTATCECGETDTADHTWDDGVVTKEAAVDVAGETTYTCTVCGETKTEAIDALVATPDDADPTQPDTGDNGIVALVGLMLLAGAGVAVASKKRA